MEKRQNAIINLIPEGQDNAISRSMLTVLSGESDRTIRSAIHDYNISDNGLILNVGFGYFKATQEDRAIVERTMNREISRSREIETTVRRMKKFLGNCKGQEELNG